jgi:hypothetical protein
VGIFSGIDASVFAFALGGLSCTVSSRSFPARVWASVAKTRTAQDGNHQIEAVDQRDLSIVDRLTQNQVTDSQNGRSFVQVYDPFFLTNLFAFLLAGFGREKLFVKFPPTPWVSVGKTRATIVGHGRRLTGDSILVSKGANCSAATELFDFSIT